MSLRVNLPGKLCPVFVSELRCGWSSQKLVGRVSRIWKTFYSQKRKEPMSLEFLLIDEKAECIVCYVRDCYIPQFDSLLEEGKVYAIQNFIVAVMRPLHRVWHHHDLHLLLNASTYIEEIISYVPAIVRHKFCVIPFEHLGCVSEDKKNLCDIIGYASTTSDVRKVIIKGQPMVMQKVDLTSLSGSNLKLTIWGRELTEQSARMIGGDSRVWLITSTLVSPNGMGGVCVATTVASRLYDSNEIHEVNQFNVSLQSKLIDEDDSLGVRGDQRGFGEYVLGLPATVVPSMSTCLLAGNVEALANGFRNHVLTDVLKGTGAQCVWSNKKAKKSSNV